MSKASRKAALAASEQAAELMAAAVGEPICGADDFWSRYASKTGVPACFVRTTVDAENRSVQCHFLAGDFELGLELVNVRIGEPSADLADKPLDAYGRR